MIRLLLLLFPLLSVFTVKDISMEPFLFEGDRVYVWRTRTIRPGQKAVFQTPRGELSIKTCLLAEGDSLEIQGNSLIHEGEEWFLQPRQKVKLLIWEKVPGEHYFFVGENRFHSEDSREWGFISREEIYGRVIAVKRKKS